MYFADFQDFRMVPWFHGTLEAYKFFNLQQNWNVVPLFNHVNLHLSKTRTYLSRWPTFTLVNVYCPINRYSYGFLDAPYAFHDPSKCLLLTFRTNLQVYKHGKRMPKHVMRTSQYGRVWGDFRNMDTNAFTTIAVPMEFRETLEMSFNRIQMQYLYTVLGSYYRNFVLYRWYDDYPKQEVPEGLLNTSLPDLMHRHSYPYWKYSKEVWRRCPNIIGIDQIDTEFADYYKANFTEFTGKMNLRYVRDLETAIYSMMTPDTPEIV